MFWRSVASAAGVFAWAVSLCPSVLAQGGESLPAVGVGELPRDLSPWGMFLTADLVVKSVLVGLVLASIVTWTIWLAKTIELIVIKRRLRGAMAVLSVAASTAEAMEHLGTLSGAAAQCVEAAASELQLSDTAMSDRGIKERVASWLERIEAAHVRRALRATGVLATIGATAPFVGLFGTVWGIMSSFVGISRTHTTNLAVVAPGIAEALLATACGLAAAIPAVVIYNLFARSIAEYRRLLGDMSAEVQQTVGRDLDRRRQQMAAPRADTPPATEGTSSGGM